MTMLTELRSSAHFQHQRPSEDICNTWRYFVLLKMAVFAQSSRYRSLMSKRRCFTRPLKLLLTILPKESSDVQFIILQISTHINGDLIFTSPWDTNIFMSKNDTIRTGHVVFVNFYCNRETSAKSGTHGATILPVWFTNISPYRKKWYKIGIALTYGSIHSALSEECRQQLRLEVSQRSSFMCFKDLALASYNGFLMGDTNYTPRIGMFIAD